MVVGGTGRLVKSAFRRAAAAAPTPRLVEMEADKELASTAAIMYEDDLAGLPAPPAFPSRWEAEAGKQGEEREVRCSAREPWEEARGRVEGGGKGMEDDAREEGMGRRGDAIHKESCGTTARPPSIVRLCCCCCRSASSRHSTQSSSIISPPPPPPMDCTLPALSHHAGHEREVRSGFPMPIKGEAVVWCFSRATEDKGDGWEADGEKFGLEPDAAVRCDPMKEDPKSSKEAVGRRE